MHSRLERSIHLKYRRLHEFVMFVRIRTMTTPAPSLARSSCMRSHPRPRKFLPHKPRSPRSLCLHPWSEATLRTASMVPRSFDDSSCASSTSSVLSARHLEDDGSCIASIEMMRCSSAYLLSNRIQREQQENIADKLTIEEEARVKRSKLAETVDVGTPISCCRP